VHALNNVGTAQLIAHDEQGRIKLEESLQLSLAHGFQEHVARAYTNLGSAALRFRDYRLAIRYLDSCIDYTSQHDLDFPMFYMMAWRARALFEQGDWDQAADDAISVLNKFQGMTTVTKLAAMAVLGHIRVRRGDPDADRLLDEARDIAIQTGELQRVAPVASARAELAWLQGNLDQLRDEARSVLGMANVHDEPWITEEFAFWMWRAGASPELSQSVVTPYADQIKGDWRTAAAAWKAKGCQYEEAMALAEGDEPAQRAALEIFEQLGAGPAAERLRHALRATGARGIPRGPRPSTRVNPAGLTNRQMEVLALMSGGFSNARIADTLFISIKTVDHHVSAILAKLDARTRAEAVSFAFQTGLIKSK